MKKYLVTGGSGFLGSALVKRLVRDGFSVRVIDNNLRGSQKNLKEVFDKIEFIEADIRDTDAVRKACKGVDGVLHLAYLNGTEYFYSHPDLVLDIGVKGMMNVVDGCIKENVKELILASSSEVYQYPPHIPTAENVPLVVPDPLNPRYSYGGGKIISELITLNYGRKYFDKVVIFRPHNVYGPSMGWEHVIPQLSTKVKNLCNSDEEEIKVPIQGDGSETRAFVFINDFIDGLMLIIEKGEHMSIYNIGTMHEVSIKDLTIKIGEVYGKKVQVVPTPLQKGGTKRRCPDITKLKQLGYEPKYSLKDGLNITVKWYDQNPPEDRSKIENLSLK